MGNQKELKVSKTQPWIVCICLAIIMYFSNGTASSSFSANMPYIKEAFDLTATQSSMIVSMRSLAASICLAILLLGYTKVPVKTAILAALTSATAAWVVFAYATSYNMLLVGGFLLGICFGFGGTAVMTAIVRNWFVESRALALAIITASTGLANIFNPQIIRRLVEAFSLKVNFMVWAVVFAVVIVVAAIVIKEDPTEAGYYPLGGEKIAKQSEKAGAVEFVESSEYAPNWICHALMFAFIFCLSAFNFSAWSQFTLLFTSVGWEKADVANFMSMCGLFLMITKIAYGKISDKFSVRKSSWFFFLACFIAMIMCGLFAGVKSTLLMGVIFFIYCIGGIFASTSLGVYAMEFSTRKNCKYIAAIYLLVFNLSNTVTVNIVGAIADANGGDYRPAYLVLAALVVVGYLCTVAAYKVSIANRKKLDAQTTQEA